MKLTNTMREAFVRAAMADVPQTDYREQIQKVLTDAAIEAMPPKVREAYSAHPDWFPSQDQNVYTPDGRSLGYYFLPARIDRIPKAALEKAQDLQDALWDQRARMDELENKLRGIALGCTTRKALAEALPEFEKYLPVEEAKTRNLPAVAVAVANVVAEFVKAGWPMDSNNATK